MLLLAFVSQLNPTSRISTVSSTIHSHSNIALLENRFVDICWHGACDIWIKRHRSSLPPSMCAGLTFAFISQIGSTSISAWGFAFTTKRWGLGKEQVKEFDEFDEMIRNVCLKTPHEAANDFFNGNVAERFNFPEEWAALVPSSFYLASMLPRFANTYLARRILASTLVHVSLIFVSWRSHFLVRPGHVYNH